MRDPSWRAAWTGALRDPGGTATVAGATALLVVAASTGLLTAWTSGQAAIEQLAAVGDAMVATGESLDLAVALPPAAPEVAEAVDARLDELAGYDAAALQVTAISWLVRGGAERVEPVVRANGRIAVAVPFHREDERGGSRQVPWGGRQPQARVREHTSGPVVLGRVRAGEHGGRP